MTNEEKKELEQLFRNASKSFNLFRDKLAPHCEKDEYGDPKLEQAKFGELDGDFDQEVGPAVFCIESEFETIWGKEYEFFNTEEA